MAREYEHGRVTKVPEIRKGDTVLLVSGKDAGKRGTVEKVIRRTAAPSAARSPYRRGTGASGIAVVVEGLNIAKRHTKPRQSSSQNERTTRIKHTVLADGKRIRVCAHCGSPLEVKAS
jgi:large subunit ribosomal protein L24